MRTDKIAFLIILMALIAVYPIVISAQDSPDETSATQIVHALGTALNDGDVDAAMTYMADDAFFITYDVAANHRYGQDEIRQLFEELVAGNFRIETEVLATYGDDGIIVTHTETWGDPISATGLDHFNATEVYVVKNGQIIGITWIMTDETKSQLMAAMASPPITPEDIIGTWRWSSGVFYFQFREDGTFRASKSIDDLNSDTPEDSGTYTVEDGILTFTSGELTRYCLANNIGIYAVTMQADETLDLVIQSDECVNRASPSPDPQHFTRYEDQ